MRPSEPQGSGLDRTQGDQPIDHCLELGAHHLVATLGEVGAIAESSLEDMTLYRSNADFSVSMHEWRLKLPPWQTSAQKYGLKIVTQHLVLALKTSSTSEEQLKIAFAIQQLLVLLDASSPDTEAKSTSNGGAKKMSPWLYDQLRKANVLESVEPFWSSQFNERVSQYWNQCHVTVRSCRRRLSLTVRFDLAAKARATLPNSTASVFRSIQRLFSLGLEFLPLDDCRIG